MNIYKNMVKIAIIISIFFLSACLIINTSSAAIINVNAADSGGIQGAVDKSNNGDTILLDPGTYKGDNNKGIEIDKSLTIRGNGRTSSVVIDPAKSNNGLLDDIFYLSSTNAHVTFINITFTNSKTTAVSNAWSQSTSSKMTFQNCVFINNEKTAILDWGDALKVSNCVFTNNKGGAIEKTWGGSLKISNSVFTNNEASLGGAIDAGGSDTFTISKCNFTNNKASIGSGAIYASNGISKVTNCIFTKNNANQGGAITSEGSGTLTISKCSFIKNFAVNDGGSIYIFSGKLTLSNSVFTGNKARNGGAIYLRGTTSYGCTVGNSIFTSNIATNGGGAIFNHDTDGICTVSDSTFTKNKAARGGAAIYNDAYVDNYGVLCWGIVNSNNNIMKDNTGNAVYNLGKITVKKTTMSGNTEGNIIGSGTVSGKITTIKPAKSNIKLAKSTTSKATIVKKKKVFTKNYIYKNYGKAIGSKKFTITIDKKFTLTGKITKTKNIAFSYNKKTKKIAVSVKSLSKGKTAGIKFKVF